MLFSFYKRLSNSDVYVSCLEKWSIISDLAVRQFRILYFGWSLPTCRQFRPTYLSTW